MHLQTNDKQISKFPFPKWGNHNADNNASIKIR